MRRIFCVLSVGLTIAAALASGTGLGDSYVLRDGDVTYMVGEGMPAESLKQIQQRFGRLFLWSRRDGRTYLIRDADALDRARAIVQRPERDRRMAELVDRTVGSGAAQRLGSRPDAYILNHGDAHVTFSSGTNLEMLLTTREQFRGGYLWVLRDGRSWVIRDEEWLDRAVALFAPQLALAPQQREVAKEEAMLDREEERLDDARGEGVRARLDEVHRKQAEVAHREEELDRREEDLERQAESQLWPLIDEAIRQGVAKPVR
jgi:hypothetical protein